MVGFYAALSFGWIVLTDWGLMILNDLPLAHASLSIAKDGLFVAVTSLVLYTLATDLAGQVGEAERRQIRNEQQNAVAVERANRFYRTLARANEAALGATDRARLCDDICRTLVEDAGMRLAWVGWVDRDTRLVTVEAAAGPAADYVKGLVISADPERAESRGPAGRAILERRSQICSDFEQEAAMAPWRERARRHGVRSAASVCVSDADGTPGTMTIYSGETGFFTAEVVRLVEQLAADLTHGLQVLAARRQIVQQSHALRESEARWQSALDVADEGVWDWDLPSGKTFFSPRLQTMLGYEPGEFRPHVGEREQRVHPEDVERTRRELADYLEGRSPRYVCEHRLRCKDGTYRWIRDRGKVVERDPEGKPLRMMGTHSDVTDQRAAHQLIANALAFNVVVFDSSPIGIITYAADGRTLSANPAAARIVGASLEGLRAQNFREIGSWRASGLLAAAEDTLAEGRPNHRQAHLVTSFGRALDLEADFVPFVFGGERQLLLMFQDVSERRRYEQRLVLLDTALQAMPAGIVITDRDGRIEWVNRGFTQLTGYDIDEALGGNPRLLRSGHQPPSFYAQMWETILRGEIWNGELVNRRKDGTEYKERMIIAPVSQAHAGITHFIAIKQDITGQKEMEARLLRAQRMESIGLLAGGIAHDLNNVLAPILLSVELLRMRATDAGERRTIDAIESAARRGSGVVRQVLTFARGIDGERARLRPRDLLRELVMIIEETFPRDITILRDVAEDTPMISGDMTQLHQVLLNLAVNARDAMPRGGTLTFSLRPVRVEKGQSAFSGEIRAGSYVLIAVQDTGQGMTREVRERIFEPFFTTKPRGKGTGLGLPTVLGIVRSHGGFIDVLSEPGAGAQFRIYLPAVPDEETGPEAPARPVNVVGAGRTVLVCDDEPAIREVARVVLGHAGFHILEAGNGRDGLDAFSEQQARISAILMDIMMPLMTGDRAAAEIMRQRPEMPVIFMSGLMEQDMIEAALRNVGAPAVTLLKKPFTATELLEAIGRRLDPG
ncbi:MAG: hypothetical protein C0502_05775 [Opitutus sp.]|nr:hypothetical protein [Opitutus sp.]